MVTAKSGTGTSKRKHSNHFSMRNRLGYTLIEILIVMLIISIVSTVAVLTVSYNRHTQYMAFAKQLTRQLLLAEQVAMMQPATLGVSFTEHSYQFFRFQPKAKDKENSWIPLSDSALGKHRIPNGIALRVIIEGKTISPAEQESSIQPALIIADSGDISAFIIYVGKPDAAADYQIVGLDNGSIQVAPAEKK